MSAGGMSAGAIIGCGMSAGGVSTGSMPKRQRKKKESGAGTTGGDLNDVIRTVGDVGKNSWKYWSSCFTIRQVCTFIIWIGEGEKKGKEKKRKGD